MRLPSRLMSLALAIPLWATAQPTPPQTPSTPSAPQSNTAPPAASARLAQVRALSRDLTLYGLPLVLMDRTQRQATNVPNATHMPLHAPINQFAHFRQFPPGSAREIVRYNFDTLYSFAWIDLRQEPMVLTVPPSPNRYYLVPVLDMWTNVFFDPGTRVTGTSGGRFAIVAPGWKGSLPPGLVRVEAPTPMVWAMGRIQANGRADFDHIHHIQNGLTLTPLSQWGHPIAPPTMPVDANIDMRTPPLLQVLGMDGVTLLSSLAQLMKTYPPQAIDTPILMRAQATLGFTPGENLDLSTFSSEELAAINQGAADAKARVREREYSSMWLGPTRWKISTENMGAYGASYEQRALIAVAGLGANLPEDAVYPIVSVDADGQRLSGPNRYRLHFPKGQLPPADAFWSLTLYDTQGYQIPNSVDRFAIGDRDALRFNSDGSLDLYIQSDAPTTENVNNWLPAPHSSAFTLTMRIYLPRTSVLTGAWIPPAVQRVVD